MSLDEAASLCSGLMTAVMSFYNRQQVAIQKSVGLTPFWEVGGRGKYSGEPIVILGGAASIGQYGRFSVTTDSPELLDSKIWPFKAIQVTRLSGFSPIIVTASPHNTDLLVSLGATHVLDRKLASSESVLLTEVKKITSKPIKYVYDAISTKETQDVAYDILEPGGHIVLVLPDEIETSKLRDDKIIVRPTGIAWPADSREVGVSFFNVLPRLLEDEDIKVYLSYSRSRASCNPISLQPNRIEVLPNGLKGIIGGLQRLKDNQVSAVS